MYIQAKGYNYPDSETSWRHDPVVTREWSYDPVVTWLLREITNQCLVFFFECSFIAGLLMWPH